MDWSPLIPTALGGVIALASGIIAQVIAARSSRQSDDRRHSADRDLRIYDAGIKRSEDRDNFQRETLLRLQEAVHDMARANGRALHFDQMNARDGKYTQLDSQLDQQIFDSQVEVQLLAARVTNDEVRLAIDKFISECIALTLTPMDRNNKGFAQSREDEVSQISRMSTAVEEVNTVVGLVLRDYLSR